MYLKVCSYIKNELPTSFNIGDTLVQKWPKMTERTSVSGYTQFETAIFQKLQ